MIHINTFFVVGEAQFTHSANNLTSCLFTYTTTLLKFIFSQSLHLFLVDPHQNQAFASSHYNNATNILTTMARSSDLPPEVRLKIYPLLLVDPVREGLRITLTLDSNNIRRGRSRCVELDVPHEQGHSAHPCRLPALTSNLHHLDFTDLMSLAMTNKRLYTEASQTIYNNADLTISLGQSSTTVGFDPAFTLFNRYLGQHCSLTREMFLSLVIHDESATMSAGDARSIVDLVNTQLPDLKTFGYYVVPSTIASTTAILRRFCIYHSRAILAIQPFVDLKDGVRTTLDSPVPAELASMHPQTYTSLCQTRQYLAEKALKGVLQLRMIRRLVRAHHTMALNRGRYLRVTLALRSSPDTDVQFKKDIPGFEEILTAMKFFGESTSCHHDMLRVMRASLLL
jgi:hypothetical protein